jgi:hypothetical protein
MPEPEARFFKRVLDPMERISEVLFGLIMVLTITCSFSVASSGSTEVRQMLFGALGCNVAWGAIDAVMYLMDRYSARGRGILALRSLRASSTPAEGRQVIANAMPPLLASVTSSAQLDQIRLKLIELPESPDGPHLVKDDWMGALGVFLLVTVATLPVVIPFAVASNPHRALRISNAVAIVILFLTGYFFGRYAGRHPWKTGFIMVMVGGAMVGLTIALGG